MAVYCLCKGTSETYMVKRGSLSEIILDAPMKCIKTGAKTYRSVEDMGGNPILEERLKNVDIFECPNCGTRIAKD